MESRKPAPTMERPCGYDVPFLSDVDPRFMCPICLLVLKDPMQTACGHRFCDSCIRRVYVTNNVLTCPVDKQYSRVNQMFQDVAINREILSLHIRCPKTDDGCPWNGELRDLEKHRELCRKEDVKCSGCDVTVLRCDLDDHQTECPNRQVNCPHCQEHVIYQDLEKHTVKCPRAVVTCETCGEVDLPRGEIEQHLDPLTGNCSKVTVVCPYRAFGCNYQAERTLLNKHRCSDKVQQQHLDLVKTKILEQESRIAELKDALTVLTKKTEEIIPIVRQNTQKHVKLARDVVERNVTGRVHWKVKVNLRRRGQYSSPVVYTGCPGYKVQLSLDLDGHRENNIRYSSLHLNLLAGDYDEQIIFPFNATCLVTLYDLSTGGSRRLRNNLTTTLVVREVPRVNPSNHDRGVYRRGLNTFLKKNELIGPRFLRHGQIHMEITILHCFYPPPEHAHIPYGGPVLTHTPVLPNNSSTGHPAPALGHTATPNRSPVRPAIGVTNIPTGN